MKRMNRILAAALAMALWAFIPGGTALAENEMVTDIESVYTSIYPYAVYRNEDTETLITIDGLVVDVENIVRHVRLPGSAGRPFAQVIIEAVSEVRAPLVLATFTVIAAIMPMAFVGGLTAR